MLSCLSLNQRSSWYEWHGWNISPAFLQELCYLSPANALQEPHGCLVCQVNTIALCEGTIESFIGPFTVCTLCSAQCYCDVTNSSCCFLDCRRFEAEPPPGHQQVRSYRNWNPPMLGNLPDDFLRILPQQSDSIRVNDACAPINAPFFELLFSTGSIERPL